MKQKLSVSVAWRKLNRWSMRSLIVSYCHQCFRLYFCLVLKLLPCPLPCRVLYNKLLHADHVSYCRMARFLCGCYIEVGLDRLFFDNALKRNTFLQGFCFGSKPSLRSPRLLQTIIKFPPACTLEVDEKQLEARQAVELIGMWEMIDVADALELLSPDFESDEACAVSVQTGEEVAVKLQIELFLIWDAIFSLTNFTMLD